jgi:hypothetical protein
MPKTAKERLERLAELYREQKRLAKCVENMPRKRGADFVIGSRHEVPYDPVRIPVTGFLPDEARDKVVAAYERSIAEVTSEIAETEAWIRSVGDPRVRRIIRMYYVEDLTWAAVAAKMSYSVDHCKRLMGDFWKKSEQGPP